LRTALTKPKITPDRKQLLIGLADISQHAVRFTGTSNSGKFPAGPVQMLDFTRQLTAVSALRYAAWRMAKRDEAVALALRSGPRFELRPDKFGNNDYGVAYEVFVHDYYEDRARLAPETVRLIVDLGANVGFTLLYFLHRYRHCQILAFEPHPGHFAQAERNLSLDSSKDRVQLYAKAAAARTRPMQLSDQASSSSLAENRTAAKILVEACDLFPLLIGRRIDLLKMDIEGGEYEILGDDRFEKLDVGAIVMEWHARGSGLDDKEWCQERLRDLGYAIEEIFSYPSHGMLWARR
jgi:FkbM family methyltransferase